LKEVLILFEGDSALREGFRSFFKEVVNAAREQRIGIKFIATESTPLKDFCIALREREDEQDIFLLMDSDVSLSEIEPLSENYEDIFRTLIRRKITSGGFWQNNLSTVIAEGDLQKRLGLMVPVMEAWIIADVDSLAEYYGRDFHRSAIPNTEDVESIQKQRVLDSLKRATRNTRKRGYHKTRHAPEILKIIKRDVVCAKSRGCKRFFHILRETLESETA